jgi:hypothetical protein
MIIADTTNNGCSAESHGQPIGVRCECGHRSLIPLERIGARGSMNRLCDLKLKCAQCGGRKFEIVLFFNGAQADAFWEGQTYADVWDLRLYGQDLNEWPAKMYRDDPNPFRSSGE